MQLDKIEMDTTEAKRAFIEYRNAVRARHSEEDAQIMNGYRWLARGHQLISLRGAIAGAGLNAQELPNLAIARADLTEIKLHYYTDGSLMYSNDFWPRRGCRRTKRLPSGTLPPRTSSHMAKAMVPLIPPGLRPKASLEHFHILWEAEWERIVPTDPALLRHVGGDLYAVLAVWDLTAIERAVLAGRLTHN